jgi:putative transcriptional regulator
MAGGARNMRMLRDLRLSTKVLILYELVKAPAIGQRDLAATLDVTPQAVSEYLKHMEEEALVEREGRTIRPTMVGFQFLQEHLQELGDFAYQAMRDVNVINSCAAIAGENLEDGEPVVLELEDGDLVARKGKWGPSTGVAGRTAKKGEDLAVVELEGMLEHRPGRVDIVTLPSALEGGTSAADVEALGGLLASSPSRTLAVLDPVGLVAARVLGLEVDIRFGVDRGALDAALRGLDVVVLGARDQVGAMLDALEAHNLKSDIRIDHSLVDVGGPEGKA